MKKILSVVLAFVMILSVVSVSVVAAQPVESDCTMSIGETRTVYLPGAVYDDYVVVKFAPLGSGKVAFSSDSTALKSDPVLEVYDDQMDKLLAEADDNGSDRDFYLEFDCEAGEVYYLAMYNLQEATSWKFSIECFHETYKNGVCMTCFAPCDHTKGDNLVGCCPCGENYVGIDVKAGDSIAMFSSNEYFWFKFEPEETAAYLLTSDNTDDEATTNKVADPAVIVVDATGDFILVSDDDISAENRNFALPYEFEEGERYFIGIYDNNNNSDNWTFKLDKVTTHSVEVEETITNEDGSTEVVTKTVEHELTFIPEKKSTCEEAGHSTAVYCETCDEYLAGNHDYGVAEECKDDDEDNKCDWCDKVIKEEEPVECSCNCHKTGIARFFFDFILIFQKLFRLNSVCACGVAHY